MVVPLQDEAKWPGRLDLTPPMEMYLNMYVAVQTVGHRPIRPGSQTRGMGWLDPVIVSCHGRSYETCDLVQSESGVIACSWSGETAYGTVGRRYSTGHSWFTGARWKQLCEVSGGEVCGWVWV